MAENESEPGSDNQILRQVVDNAFTDIENERLGNPLFPRKAYAQDITNLPSDSIKIEDFPKNPKYYRNGYIVFEGMPTHRLDTSPASILKAVLVSKLTSSEAGPRVGVRFKGQHSDLANMSANAGRPVMRTRMAAPDYLITMIPEQAQTFIAKALESMGIEEREFENVLCAKVAKEYPEVVQNIDEPNSVKPTANFMKTLADIYNGRIQPESSYSI